MTRLRVVLAVSVVLAVPQQATVRMPPDVIFDQTVFAAGAAAFRHSTHFAFSGVSCVTCHPAPFSILHPARRASHDEMNAGRSCGSCHDGRHAFGTTGDANCAVCHLGFGTPQNFKQRDVVIQHSADSPGAVLFRHTTHIAAGGGCVTCHPAPFALKAAGMVFAMRGEGRPPAAKAERALPASSPAAAPTSGHEACGSCHDGRATFATDDDAACERCHRSEGGAP